MRWAWHTGWGQRLIAWKIEEVGDVESTNAVALDVVRGALHEKVLEKGSEAISGLAGRVFLAERQSSGRGQHGRAWASPAGGLYMSAILGDLNQELRPLAALLTGVAVAESLDAEGIPEIAVRWPNDIVINGKKVAGILCEGVAMGRNGFVWRASE